MDREIFPTGVLKLIVSAIYIYTYIHRGIKISPCLLPQRVYGADSSSGSSRSERPGALPDSHRPPIF